MIIENISKTFGRTRALSYVSFTVSNSEIVGYVGLNGAGKTTTIRIIAGVLNPDTGRVVVDGFDVFREKKKASERIGWVPEKPVFEEEHKALDYFTYLAGYYGVSRSDAIKLGRELLDRVGLSDALYKKLSEYSQGMKKRFALAVSMISDPANYVFDEVLNGLDPQGIQFFRELTREFRKQGKAVLFSSHILSEVEQIADRVVFIHKGRIIGVYTMDEVRRLAKPSIMIRVAEELEKAVEIARSFGEVSVENSVIHVKPEGKVGSEEIVAELVRKGVHVREVKYEERDLESFFFELVRRGEG
ncbi:MAG: ABC transporter ATP-binding protein [Desulfurococcus sp.]|nr:ABC transporter ATP-binding protein [Desulfurococcus sp.]